MINILINFWYGKISLWKSYWIVGELINSLIVVIIYNYEIRLLNNKILYQELPFLNFNNFSFFSKMILLIWTILITIGIWRSAENYKGRFIWIALTLTILSYRIFTLRLLIY